MLKPLRRGMTHMEDASDEELVRKAASGEDDAYRELVARYKNYVFAVIGRQIGDRNTAEELAQDVFVKAYKALSHFRSEATFKTWLTKITLNTTRSYFKSRRYKESIQTVSNEDVSITEQGKLAPDSVVTRELLSVFQLCFGALSPLMQDVMTLCSYQGESYEQASTMLDIPVGTVRSRLNRARIALKECMQSKGAL
jgi:RNA polymerase sigma-70 factor (ECF subfamily)